MENLSLAKDYQTTIGTTLIKPERFRYLSFGNIDPATIKNPVIKMLAQEDATLTLGKRCSIIPEDEWLIFLD